MPIWWMRPLRLRAPKSLVPSCTAGPRGRPAPAAWLLSRPLAVSLCRCLNECARHHVGPAQQAQGEAWTPGRRQERSAASAQKEKPRASGMPDSQEGPGFIRSPCPGNPFSRAPGRSLSLPGMRVFPPGGGLLSEWRARREQRGDGVRGGQQPRWGSLERASF